MTTGDKGIKFSNLATFKQEMDTILANKVSTSDSRLTDARPASDVYSWAKAATKPTYTASEVGALATGDISDWAKAANKPSYSVSEISGALASSSKGAANGVASLGSDGKVLASQLPSYVDDVIEGYKDSSSVTEIEQFVTNKAYSIGQIIINNNKYYRFITNHAIGAFDSSEVEEISQFSNNGETGKIYSDIFTNKTYRWSGSQYTQIKGDLSIGEITGSAFDGKKGKDLETAVYNLLVTTTNIPSDFTWATENEVKSLFSV